MKKTISHKIQKHKMKPYVCFIFLFISMSCILTGCFPTNEGISVKTQLPENTELHFLLKCQPNKEAENPETEIAKYNEDGFFCADIWLDGARVDYVSYNNSYILKFAYYVDFSQLRKYVQKYKHIRLAVTDTNGNILQISPTFSLLVKNRNLFWESIEYDYKLNEIKGCKARTVDEMHYKIMFASTIVSIGCAVISLLLLVTVAYGRDLIPIYFFWGIPARIMLWLQFEQYFMPYYRKTSLAWKGTIIKMIFLDYFWILCSIPIGLTIYHGYHKFRKYDR